MFSQKFQLAINRSFQFIPRTGAKYFITLDLRETNLKSKIYMLTMYFILFLIDLVFNKI